MKNNVYVVGRDYAVARLFETNSWTLVSEIHKADLVVFTGGEDVCPALYGEKAHKTTYHNLDRDFHEIQVFSEALFAGKPMVGICRGGQFLNVMCGGSMYQDVDNHALGGTHVAYRSDHNTDRAYHVTSTHHQMMRPSQAGKVLVWAGSLGEVRTVDTVAFVRGIEVVWYERQQCLCFQPHPEFNRGVDTRELFFDLIATYIKLQAGE